MSKLEYAVCSSTDLNGLARAVTQQINEGWEPIGGAFYGAEDRLFEGKTITMLFHQAVKREQVIIRKLN